MIYSHKGLFHFSIEEEEEEKNHHVALMLIKYVDHKASRGLRTRNESSVIHLVKYQEGQASPLTTPYCRL